MTTDKMAADFFASIKEQLVKEVLDELRPAVAAEVEQRRLTVAGAAKYTGLSEDTIYTLCREKKIPHYRAGEEGSRKPRIFFRVQSLDLWMQQQERDNCIGWD